MPPNEKCLKKLLKNTIKKQFLFHLDLVTFYSQMMLLVNSFLNQMVKNNILINDFVEVASKYDDLDNFVDDEEIVFEAQAIKTGFEENTQSIN